VGDAGADDAYTVQEAARILRTTERTVRRRLERGDLEGTRDPTTGRWRAATRSVPAAMPERPPKPASLEEPLEASESLQGYQERARPSRGSWDVSRGACNLRRSPRSTLREQLDRERARADRLEEELRDFRNRRSCWSRIFGCCPDDSALCPHLRRTRILGKSLNRGN
jgi:excisionase family DNA binding protein